MKEIEQILQQDSIADITSSLKEKSVVVPSWSDLVKDYEPEFHDIVTDKSSRKDKILEGGKVEVAARIAIGLEKLLVRRFTDFTFAIDVKRIYYTNNDIQKEIASAIEKIYTTAHINSENIKRGIAYYASCEIFTLWYTRKNKNNLYGFPCDYKLKCKTYNPMSHTKLYPLFDDKDDMIAMSYEYKKKVKDEWVTYFETFTADKHFVWSNSENDDWKSVINNEEVTIEKIPGAYLSRQRPVYDELSILRKELEYTISRNSDIIAYNAAPVLKVVGQLVGNVEKDETRRVYRLTDGGDVSYVSWSQSIESLKYHIDTILRLYFMQAQMPDVSFDNLKSLGNIGYDARKTLLTDAHLRIGEESGPWVEFFERECNVIKAFLKKMNTRWSEDDIDAVRVEHVITPFVQEDELNEIKKWQLANGNKPLISHRESVVAANLTEDPAKTYEEIGKEQLAQSTMEQAGLIDTINAL